MALDSIETHSLRARESATACTHAHVTQPILEIGMRPNPSARFDRRDEVVFDVPVRFHDQASTPPHAKRGRRSGQGEQCPIRNRRLAFEVAVDLQTIRGSVRIDGAEFQHAFHPIREIAENRHYIRNNDLVFLADRLKDFSPAKTPVMSPNQCCTTST
jgi:hypothetical protein